MTTYQKEIQLETDEYRVIKWTIPPEGFIPMHTHEFDYIVVPLSSGIMHLVHEDESESRAKIVAGHSYTRGEGTTHQVENRSSTDTIIFTEIELLR